MLSENWHSILHTSITFQVFPNRPLSLEQRLQQDDKTEGAPTTGRSDATCTHEEPEDSVPHLQGELFIDCEGGRGLIPRQTGNSMGEAGTTSVLFAAAFPVLGITPTHKMVEQITKHS